MTITEKKLEDAKNKVSAQLHHHVCAYVNLMGLRMLVAEKEPGFLFNLQNHSAPQPLNIPNSISYTFQHLTIDSATAFLNFRSALELCEKDPAFIEAFNLVDPLVQEVRRLEDEIRAEVAKEAGARHAVLEAEEAAKAAAIAKIDRDPAVLKAREALQAATPKPLAEPVEIPLVRGVIKTRPEVAGV